jgi:hypothetical protein
MEDTQYCNVMLNYEFKGDIEARTRITPAPTITLGGQRIQIIDDQALVGIRACLRSPPYVGNQCDETTKEDLRKEMKRALGNSLGPNRRVALSSLFQSLPSSSTAAACSSSRR